MMTARSLFALFLITGMLTANPENGIPNDQQIMQMIFNAEWVHADSLIDLKISSQPDNARYYYMKLPLYYYTRYFNNGALNGDSLMQRVYEYSLKTIESAEKTENPAERYFYLGCGYDYLSRYQIRYSGRWDAYWSARKAVNYLEDAFEEDPQMYDALMGIGVIEYFTSRLTGFTRSLAWLTGMLGDRETALSNFHQIAEKGNLCRDEARFALVSVYRYLENDYEAAHSMAATLLEDIPNNSFIRNIYLQTQLLQLIENEGVSALTGLTADTLSSRYQVTNSGVLNQMGYYLVGQGRLRDAESIFLRNIELFPDETNPYDSMAECYQTMGEYQKSIDYSRLALNKLESDQTINEQFRERLREILEQRFEDLASEVNI